MHVYNSSCKLFTSYLTILKNSNLFSINYVYFSICIFIQICIYIYLLNSIHKFVYDRFYLQDALKFNTSYWKDLTGEMYKCTFLTLFSFLSLIFLSFKQIYEKLTKIFYQVISWKMSGLQNLDWADPLIVKTFFGKYWKHFLLVELDMLYYLSTYMPILNPCSKEECSSTPYPSLLSPRHISHLSFTFLFIRISVAPSSLPFNIYTLNFWMSKNCVLRMW